jgi:UDP-N-acetylglucosamine:LPS N-acetylglucosamine transferase
MSRILLIWELGADYGHISTLLPIALEMKRRGHEPVLVLRDLCWAEKILGGHGLSWLQAPVWMINVSGIPQPISYPEIMFHYGFSHTQGLFALCRAWRNLIKLVKPDLLVIEFGATSMLATLGMGIPRVRIGTGATAPPLTQPMLSHKWWESQPTARLVDIEGAVLKTANVVLQELGEEPLAALHEMLKSDDEFILSSPALDHFPQRQDANYCGAIMNLEHGATPNWPNLGRKRVFAYIKTSYPHFGAILKALAELDVSTVVHAPGISVKNIKTYESGNLTFSVDPVRMEDARRQCDLGICHAGAGTTEALLAAGKPALLLPMQGEQESMARRVEQIGAGLWVNPEAKVVNFKKLLKRLLSEPEFTRKAVDFASANPERSQPERVSQIVDRCEVLIARSSVSYGQNASR